MVKVLSGLFLCSRLMSVTSQFPKNRVTLLIEVILKNHLKPTHLEVINESFSHTGISPLDEPELSSHYKLVVVSPLFENKSIVQCHRMVQQPLQDAEVFNLIHALQIVARTPEAWKKNQDVPEAPKCQGGDGRRKN
uniref:Protein BolA homolog n=1 Tax=Cacopsylla melanoneura TaxID=428564 RepID=A0A8D8ZPS2_9HEMI